jgi:25S rRNA (uracil2634-N3)-methyltransferase
MGKNKRLSSKTPKRQKHPNLSKTSRPTGITKSSHSRPSKSNPSSAPKRTHIQPSQSAPIIPFQTTDRILLVGEGDLSFTRALVTSLGCKHVTATVLEGSENELCEKYPSSEGIVGARQNLVALKDGGGDVRYGVDVTKKNFGMGKSPERWERVVFNFPHVGGKSTDVNRQVRYNQGIYFSLLSTSSLFQAPYGAAPS